MSYLGLELLDESLKCVEAVAGPSDGVDIVRDEVVDILHQTVAVVHCRTLHICMTASNILFVICYAAFLICFRWWYSHQHA